METGRDVARVVLWDRVDPNVTSLLRMTGAVILSLQETDKHGEEKQNEYKRAYPAGDVTVTYIECDVIPERNLTDDYSRLPPWGRLDYFS